MGAVTHIARRISLRAAIAPLSKSGRRRITSSRSTRPVPGWSVFVVFSGSPLAWDEGGVVEHSQPLP